MKIEFQSKTCFNYYTGKYSGKQKFTEGILKKYRNKINYLMAAESLSELSKIRSLNIEKYERHWSARINIQYRIEFDFIKPDRIIILKISKHYEK